MQRHHPVRFALGLVGLGLAVLSAYTYVGPYRWFAELQMVALGSYSPKLALVCATLLCILPLVGLHALYERTELGRAQSARLENGVWGSLVVTFQRSPRAGRIMLVGAVFGVMGTWFAARGLMVGELAPLDVATLEAGQEPPTRHVDLSGGVLDYEMTSSFREGSGVDDYVPYTSQDEMTPVVFVAIPGSAPEPDEDAPIRGVLERNGLPGPVRTDLEAAGAIASEHWVLRTRSNHEHGRNVGIAFFVFGWLVVGAGAFVVWRGRPRHS